jgi:hypothetical protein
MGVIILSCLLSGGIGFLVGGYHSILGWIAASNLLFVTITVAGLLGGTGPLAALGWAIAVALAFNAGLFASLAVRAGVARPPMLAGNFRKTFPDR